MALVLIVPMTHTVQSVVVVLAENNNSQNIQTIRRNLKLHSVFETKKNRMRERKQWFKIIEQTYTTQKANEDGIQRGSMGTGHEKDKTGYGKGKGKGKGKMIGKNMKGKGKGTRLPQFCSELDFEDDEVDHDFHGGKGMGSGKDKKWSEKGHRSKMSKDKGLEKGYGKGKGKGSYEKMGKGKGGYEKEGCRRNVFKKARRIPDISIFVSLIEQAELEDIFLCNGPFTVLAPSNAAFMNNAVVSRYLSDASNVDELRDVLLYHILPGLLFVDDFRKGSVDTLLGDDIRVTMNPVMFNGVATIEEGDFKACNGVIHIIDDILLPPGTVVKACKGLLPFHFLTRLLSCLSWTRSCNFTGYMSRARLPFLSPSTIAE
jgi:uncharacterized surface protein with fasciclin (FAS1) repeats